MSVAKEVDATDGEKVDATNVDSGDADAKENAGDNASATDETDKDKEAAVTDEAEPSTVEEAAADVEKKQAELDEAGKARDEARDELQGVVDARQQEIDEAVATEKKDLDEKQAAYEDAATKSDAAERERQQASSAYDDAKSSYDSASSSYSEAEAAVKDSGYESVDAIDEAAAQKRSEANEIQSEVDDLQNTYGIYESDAAWVDDALETFKEAESDVETVSASVTEKKSAYETAKNAVRYSIDGNFGLRARFEDLARRLDNFIAADNASDKASRKAASIPSESTKEKAEAEEAAKAAKENLDRAVASLQSSHGGFWADTWYAGNVAYSTTNMLVNAAELVNTNHALNGAEVARDDALKTIDDFAKLAPEGEYKSEAEKIAAGIAKAREITDQIATLTKQLDTVSAEAKKLEDLSDNLAKAKSDLAAASSELEKAEKDLKEATEKYDALEGQTSADKSARDAAQKAYNDAYNEKTPAIYDKYREKYDTAQSNYYDALKAYNSASDALSKSQATYNRLVDESRRSSESYDWGSSDTTIYESSDDSYMSSESSDDTHNIGVTTDAGKTEKTTATEAAKATEAETQLVENTVSSLTTFEVDREAAENVAVVSEPVLKEVADGVYEVEQMPGVDTNWLAENSVDDEVVSASDIENYWWYVYIDGEAVRIMDKFGNLAPGIDHVLWVPTGKLGATTYENVYFAQAGGMTVVITASSVRGIDVVRRSATIEDTTGGSGGSDSILAVDPNRDGAVVTDGVVVPNMSLSERIASYIPARVSEDRATAVASAVATAAPLSATADTTDPRGYVTWSLVGVATLLYGSARRRRESGSR